MPTDLDQPLPPVWEGKPPAGALAAPGLTYLTGEEVLRSSFMANVANTIVTVTGRVLRPDNTISRINFTVSPAGSRTLTPDVRGLSSGWLLDLTARVTTGAPAFGAVWGMFELGVGLGAGFLPMETLRMGFLTANTPLSVVSSVSLLPLDGPGALRSITGTTPGAGAEITETCPTNARWEPLSFHCQIVTNATVGNRFPQLILDDGANELTRVAVQSAIVASSTVPIAWAEGFPNNAQQVGYIEPMTTNGRMGAGFRLRTLTSGIQAGDQYSQVQYLVREWMTGE